MSSISLQFPLNPKPSNLPNPHRRTPTNPIIPIPHPFPKQSHLPTLPQRPHLHPIHLSFSDDFTPPSQNDDVQRKPFSAKQAFTKLKNYGSSGILAYGILNTVYYTTTFLLVWFYVAPVSGRFGYLAAVKRFLKVMAMVWAGSQVTKVVRAAGAVALAPFVEKGLKWYGGKFKFRSRGVAYISVVGICVGMALLVFLAVTLVSA